MFVRHKEFGTDPAMVGCKGNGSCIAVCPSETTGLQHVAFRTTKDGMASTQRYLERRGIAFRFEDHDLQQSIYFEDPINGYEVEVTFWPVGKTTHTRTPAEVAAAATREATTTAFYSGAVSGIVLTVLATKLVRALITGQRMV